MQFSNFIKQWDDSVTQEYRAIPLFNPDFISGWNNSQKKLFVKVFYHLRGHFVNILWHMLNHAPDEMSRKVMLDYIAEEGGIGAKNSHEQLFCQWAEPFGVDIGDEEANHTFYLPLAKEFNRKHRLWLYSSEWPAKVAFFAAYERFDNLDYEQLNKVAIAMGSSEESRKFFTVHMEVEHYDQAQTGFNLKKIWDREPDTIKEAFRFTKENQIWMWSELSKLMSQ